MVNLQIKLPENYLEEETRDGFLVTKERKELWAVLLDILVQIQKICEKHNIEYFATGGTLLGAIRHDGFIPWDDDIDLAMERNQIEKFIEVAEKELKFPYFLQIERTDPFSIRRIVKIMRLDTASIIKSEAMRKFKFAQGIFVDIFPLDNLPDDCECFDAFAKNLKKLYKKARAHRNRLFPDVNEKNPFKKFIKCILCKLTLLFKIKNKNYYRLIDESKKYNHTETEYIGEIGWNQDIFIEGGKEKGVKVSEKSSLVEHDFEFLKLPVFENSEDYLQRYFGDWKTPVQGASDHGDLIYSTETSYKEILKNLNL